MSFQTLNKSLLKQAAEDFGVDVEEDASKAELINALKEEGVTWGMYKEAFPDEKDQDDADEDGDEVEAAAEYKKPLKTVLLKMTRANGTYEIRGYKFTRSHPYLPVSEDDANYILDLDPNGFKIASPREAEEFYS